MKSRIGNGATVYGNAAGLNDFFGFASGGNTHVG
jgi:hypothetical protein